MAATFARLQAAHGMLLRLMDAAGLLREARHAAGRNDSEQAEKDLPPEEAKQAELGRAFLARVIAAHPGTPWAALAQDE